MRQADGRGVPTVADLQFPTCGTGEVSCGCATLATVSFFFIGFFGNPTNSGCTHPVRRGLLLQSGTKRDVFLLIQ